MNHLQHRIFECCERLGIDHAATFHRNSNGEFDRGNQQIVDRWAVAYLARAWHLKSGMMSYPEITAGCGMESHVTVYYGVERMLMMQTNMKRIRVASNILKAEGHTVIRPTQEYANE